MDVLRRLRGEAKVSTPSSYGPTPRASSLSPAASLVRRNDPDRFLTALFAPAPQRETLFVLYAFNNELARARAVVSEPMLALMRLQWWREVVEGARRRHEVAGPLGAALDAGALRAEDLAALIDAREIEAESAIPTLEDWRGYLMGTAGGLAVAAGRLLGAPNPEALRGPGAAYGAAGVLRAVPALARRRRCLLPADVLAQHGLSVEAAIAAPLDAPALAAMRELAREAQGWLGPRDTTPPRAFRAAALPAVFARRDLARAPPLPERHGIGDQLAVVRAALLGR
ncbi:MAG: squalene/phytoene synthase family protein [Acetobacteraceae bacterium]|nr:squalene/phytoene synthase family protein [Acetobacteraceae bacterium]